MFFGILSSIFYSLCDIYYKKALTISKRYITDSFYQFIGYFFLTIVLFVVVLAVEQNIDTMSLFVFGILFVNSIFNVICEYLEQYAYRGEKISVLTPYGEAETIFATILWFIFFSNNSTLTFLSALLAGVVLIAGSIKRKHLKVNKYCLALTLSGFLTSLRFIVFWYVLLEFSELTSLFYSISISFLIITAVVVFKRELYLVDKTPWKLNKLIFIESGSRILANLITLYLIKNIGIVEAVLVGMTYLAVNLLLSYYYFKDRATKKELIMIAIVFACIVFWVNT